MSGRVAGVPRWPGGDREAVPEWAYEPVRLVESRPEWGQVAAVFADEVQRLLGPWLTAAVEHIGSTAVPGLLAKPVIDLQAMATTPDAVVGAESAALAACHWHVVPRELDRRPWRRFVVRADPEGRRRLAHLHLMSPGASRGREQIAFRDRLRTDAALAWQYAELKTGLASAVGGDREAYTEAKAAFVARALDD